MIVLGTAVRAGQTPSTGVSKTQRDLLSAVTTRYNLGAPESYVMTTHNSANDVFINHRYVIKLYLQGFQNVSLPPLELRRGCTTFVLVPLHVVEIED